MSVAESIDIVPALVDPNEHDDLINYIRSGEITGGIDLLTEDEVDRILDRIAQRLGIDQLLTNRGVQTILTRENRRVIYITAKATDALAAMHRIEHETIEKPTFCDFDGVKFFTARVRATHTDACLVCSRGRRPAESTGTVPFPRSRDPQDIANAHMHSETKARRRSTLVVLGIGFVDESELDGLMSAANGSAQREIASVSTRPVSAPAPASDPEPTALDRLRDSLAQFEGPLSVDQLVAIWCDHEREITDEAGGDDERIGYADALIRERAAVPMSKHAFHTAIRVAKACEREPQLRAVRSALAAAPSLAGIASTWRELQPEIAGLDAHHQDLAQQIAVDALRARDGSISQPKKWLRDALAAPSVARFETPRIEIGADHATSSIDPLAQAASPDRTTNAAPETPSASNRIATRNPRVRF